MFQFRVQIRMMIPRGVEQRDKTNSPFDEPAGEQTIDGELPELTLPAAAMSLDFRFDAVDAILVDRFLVFA